MGGGEVGIEFDGSTELSLGVVEFAAGEKGEAEEVVGFRGIGCKLHNFLEGGAGGRNVAVLQGGDTLAIEGFGGGRLRVLRGGKLQDEDQDVEDGEDMAAEFDSGGGQIERPGLLWEMRNAVSKILLWRVVWYRLAGLAP